MSSIGIPGFGGRFLDDHPKFVVNLFFGGRLVSHFFWWTFFGGRLVSHFFWWTQFKRPFLFQLIEHPAGPWPSFPTILDLFSDRPGLASNYPGLS